MNFLGGVQIQCVSNSQYGVAKPNQNHSAIVLTHSPNDPLTWFTIMHVSDNECAFLSGYIRAYVHARFDWCGKLQLQVLRFVHWIKQAEANEIFKLINVGNNSVAFKGVPDGHACVVSARLNFGDTGVRGTPALGKKR